MDDRLYTYLESMHRAAAKALVFMEGQSLDAFLQDEKTQAAVSMSLIVIGEGANNIALRAPQFVATHSDWPWDRMRGLRNRIAHGYDALELSVIWSTVVDYLPTLISAIEALGELDPRLWPKE